MKRLCYFTFFMSMYAVVITPLAWHEADDRLRAHYVSQEQNKKRSEIDALEKAIPDHLRAPLPVKKEK